MSLALSTLIYEWRRYMAAMIALAMSGVLMLALVGLFVGLLSSFTATIDRSPAQLIVLPAASTSMAGQTAPMPARVLPLLYRHPQVIEARAPAGSFGPFFGPGADKPVMVSVNGVDTEPGAVTFPMDLGEDVRLSLSVPFNIAVDESALVQLKVKQGDLATMNGRTVRVDKIVSNYGNIQAPTVFASRATLRLMGQDDPNQLGSIMLRLKDPSLTEQVKAELNAMSDGQYRAWGIKELSDATIQEVMQSQMMGVMLGFLSIIGFIIGVVITWQTLRGAILANIKEFASLRALGVSIGNLRWVVMELSLWVGVAGVLASGFFLSIIAVLGRMNNLPMSYPIPSVIQTILLLLAIAVGSGMLTLGDLKKGEPADLLK
jgi:putative ABC transport system permease protein